MHHETPHHPVKLPSSITQKLKARDSILTQALTKLATAGIVVQQCSPHHLKYAPLNYYPRRGIIHRDGSESPHEKRGIDAFIKACFDEAGVDPDIGGYVELDLSEV